MRSIAAMALAIAVALAGAGCSVVSSRTSSEPGDATVGQRAPAQPILETEAWGVVDGMLSVVVRNTTDRTLRSASGVITARDANDVLISSTLDDGAGACCAVADLPPGAEYGFYVDVGPDAERIDRVDVAYRQVSWEQADAPSGGASNPLTARPLRIDGNGLGAVVVAKVRNQASTVDQARVQALLYGPDGDFLAVVSGRWFCFTRGMHEISMQLLHPVPAGTTAKRVIIRPIADDADGAAVQCAGPAQAG